MTGWLVLAVNGAGFVATYRLAYPLIHDSLGDDPPSAEDRGVSAIIALLVSMVWPATLVGWVVYRVATPVSPRERAAALAAREARVRELERSLGIGDPE